MGVIQKVAIMKWHIINKKHYESKGYVFTKYKDEFEVKVEDLTKGSNIRVDVQCDGCNNLLKNIIWQSYIKGIELYGKYYCRKCINSLFSTPQRLKTLLKNTINFEQWCINNLSKNESDEILLRWDYDLNKCKPSEVAYSSSGFNKKGYWFKCLKHPEHMPEQKYISDFTRGCEGMLDCHKCNSVAQYLIDTYGENALELYWDYNKNTKSPWCSHKNGADYVWIKCQEKDYHESYKIQCNSFINKGHRCSYCQNFKVHPLDSLGQYIINNYGEEFLNLVWSDKNKNSPCKYSPKAPQKAWWKCTDGKHEDYCRSICGSTNYEYRCPDCVRERDESFLQEKVRLYLNQVGYKVLHEHNCNIKCINPKTNYSLPYDNEIVELKLVCEVHGSQHYDEIKGKWFNPNFDLHRRKLYDRYKKFIAYKQGYNYLEIPYWTDNKQEEWKKLIDNKIKKIQNITMTI